MGLDMYLEARRFLWIFENGAGEDVAIGKAISAALPEMGDLQPTTVVASAAYWRKANAIHRWFVDHCQGGVDDCRHAYVSRDALIELRNTVVQVLNDHSLAATLLPSKDGFFFGGTEYDEWYFRDLTYTRDQLIRLLNDDNLKNWDFYYHSSW
jgi:hypothetical protein